MTQFARPISDISVGSFLPTPIWSRLNEVVADDAVTEVSTTTAPFGADGFEVRLATVSDPHSTADHILRVRTKDNDGVGIAILLLSNGASILEFDPVTTPGAWITTVIPLTTAQAAVITSYSLLSVQIFVNDPSGTGITAEVSWIELEVPSPRAPAVYDVVLWARPDE